MVDQLDRDYELWEFNAHPYQTMFYEFYNNLRQEQIENQELRNQGEEPIEDQVLRIAEERIAQEQETTGKEVDRMRQVKVIRLKFSCRLFEMVTQLCCLLYTSPSPRDQRGSRMPSSA